MLTRELTPIDFVHAAEALADLLEYVTSRRPRLTEGVKSPG